MSRTSKCIIDRTESDGNFSMVCKEKRDKKMMKSAISYKPGKHALLKVTGSKHVTANKKNQNEQLIDQQLNKTTSTKYSGRVAKPIGGFSVGMVLVSRGSRRRMSHLKKRISLLRISDETQAQALVVRLKNEIDTYLARKAYTSKHSDKCFG